MKSIIKMSIALAFCAVAAFAFAGCNSSPGEVYPDLVGRWTTATIPQSNYVFNDDGTGTRRFSGDSEPFTWGVTDGTLRIHRDSAYVNSGEIRNERWDFTIGTNRVLNMRSQQDRSISINHTQVGIIDPALIGTWEWDDDPTWRYVFNENGGGNRGFEGETEAFTWGTVDGNQLRIFHIGSLTDSWNFTITGDSLWLGSGQQAGLEFNYTRRD